MSKPQAKMHTVTLTVTNEHGGKADFAPGSDLWSEERGHLHFDKDAHGMRKQDVHLVEFVLDDRTGQHLRFPADPHDAMWVAKVEDRAHPICPDATTGTDYAVIDPMCVCDEGQRLIVRNENPRAEDWAFTLNLVKPAREDGGQARVSWDPIFNNGGNGRP